LPAPGEVSAVTFTERQTAVIQAIRIGKANKTIAYELNMCESTVKVHVRNIMKKLRATNRTQISFIAHQMLKDGLLTSRAK
jgi:DNA-binding NarL/FixJ family response regulator